MVAVPPEMPVTIPEPLPIVATVVVLLLHVPPDVLLLNDVVNPTHKDVIPVIVAGSGLTVTVIVA
jgi:hypothetical protein